jgi:cysteine desulfurase
MPSRLYLDHNSTSPLDPRVAEVMWHYARQHPGNPASAHRAGASARRALDDARQTVASLLGASPNEVIFTSGATEANNLAIRGGDSLRVCFSEIEHPSVVEPARLCVSRGAALHTVAVDAQGRFVPESFPSEADDTTLVLAQLANHETGVLQNIASLRQRLPHARFHCDATQAVGKVPIHFHQLGISSLACSAHKFNGPPGIGMLLVNRCTRLKPLLVGGHQQNGLRPGTEPVLLAVGLAHALSLAVAEIDQRRATCERLRQVFLQSLGSQTFVLNPETTSASLPHTINISFPGCPRDLLFIRLDLAGIDCSTGSACSSGSLLASPVLKAMGVQTDRLASALRFSLSHVLPEDAVRDAAQRVAREVSQLRAK